MAFFEYNKMEEVNPAIGNYRKVLAHDGSLLGAEMRLDEGAVGAMHKHIHEQLTYILEGEFEFTIGEEKHYCKVGDTMYMPSNVEHGCICLKKGRFLDVFTPIREDFL